MTYALWSFFTLLAATLAAPLDESAVPRPAQATPVSGIQAGAEDRSTPGKTAAALNPRVLFIRAENSPRSDEALARLRESGGVFDKLRSRGWKIGAGPQNHLQVVDRQEILHLVEQLQVRDFPTVACVDDGRIIRSFTSGCTTPLDVWTFGFLAKGVDQRPPGTVPEAARVATTGRYPLRGNHWSVDDDWNPTKAKVIGHLRGPNHGHQIRVGWEIENWSYEELRSLHDNLHEREMGGVTFSTSRSQPANQFSATRKVGGR